MSKILGKLRRFAASPVAVSAAGVAAAVGVLAASGVAGAATYDPTSALTTFADNFGTSAGPVVLAVGSAFVGLALLFWGVRFAFAFVGSRTSRR